MAIQGLEIESGGTDSNRRYDRCMPRLAYADNSHVLGGRIREVRTEPVQQSSLSQLQRHRDPAADSARAVRET